jgi:hypothetical protein
MHKNQFVRDQFRNISESLLADSKKAGGTGHAVTTGLLREKIINEFLLPHLPSDLSIKSGIIIDSSGQKSKQQDIIIVDNRFPIIDVGDSTQAIILAESVLATIEVKSKLNKTQLINSLRSITKTKSLIRKGEQEYVKAGIEITTNPPLPIYCYIFSFEGDDLVTILDHISDYATQENDGGIVPEAICLLKQGVLLRSLLRPKVVDTKVMLPSAKGEVQITMSRYSNDALLVFYSRILDDVMPTKLRSFSIDEYYSFEDLS